MHHCIYININKPIKIYLHIDIPTVFSHCISRYRSIHPSIHQSIHLYIHTIGATNLALLYYPMSGTSISPGWIHHLVASSKSFSSGSYWISQESLNFLRPKPAFPSSGILSVIKVIKILKLRSPVLKKS
jgi:hypothetical protein